MAKDRLELTCDIVIAIIESKMLRVNASGKKGKIEAVRIVQSAMADIHHHLQTLRRDRTK